MPQPQQYWILNPLSEARDLTHILLDTSQVLNPLSHSGNSSGTDFFFFFFSLKNTEAEVMDISHKETWGK